MEDGEQPGAYFAVAVLVPTTDGTFQAILHQVVCGRPIAHERTGITAERGYQRFDLQQHVLHVSLYHHSVCT
jgi:hypothetical protein